jgi:hypothetical protein
VQAWLLLVEPLEPPLEASEEGSSEPLLALPCPFLYR